ncbi:FAD/NAD(P)-binding protein [Ruania suaedae]|uniref:FAD/NAD(P)-binding protein n=1 Tax=Ruania suaedae TaxID=2897774 RepID=UPI001E314969|nr:FAD/NAD(P)-binding protein [Ruania suaedae]UFU03644.1 FAD/NAD(P)-binding protein [Ruania suaedae]
MSTDAAAGNADILAVGAGPQMLRALADLEIALETTPDRRRHRAPVRVVAVDPEDPGAGAVWRVDQPPALRMNVSAGIVDLRCPSVPWDLRQWHHHQLGTACDRYPSRSRVGRYLRWVWERLRSSPWFTLEHARATAVGVSPGPDGWSCRIEGEAPAQRATLAASRVLLCTGHRESAPFDYARLVAGEPSTAAGRTVLVEGAALTAFDAVMCLTAGRGGTWDRRADLAAVPRYRASGREPDRIVLSSRSGRMMLPKPVEPSRAMLAAVATLRRRWSTDPLGERWWDTLLEAARRAAAAHDVELDVAAARAWLDAPPALADSAAVAGRWREDLRRATGEPDADPAWWLGRAWAAAYPDLLASLERQDRREETWTTFRRRASTLERWAFGPPAELVAQLVALIDVGRLTVTIERVPPSPPGIVAHIAPGGVLPHARPWAAGVSAPVGSWRPGGRFVPGAPLWAGLLADGHVTVRPGETGVLTRPDGTCLRADGTTSAGLSALGRPTEGPVVDHDSLQRHLHHDATRWAAATAHDLLTPPARTSDRPDRPSQERPR